jgi:hypothetical protein
MHTVVLIEIEGHDLGERNLACPVSADELAVYADGRASRSEAEDAEVLACNLALDGAYNAVGQQDGEVVGIVDNDGSQTFPFATQSGSGVSWLTNSGYGFGRARAGRVLVPTG